MNRSLAPISLLLFAACTLPTTPIGRTATTHLSQTWVLLNREEAGELLNTTEGDVTYSFFKSGDVTRFEGARYSVGTWRLPEQNQLVLDFAGPTRGGGTFAVNRLTATNLDLQSLADGPPVELQFVTSSLKHESLEANPFHPSTNAWRLRPAQRESEAELRARVRNHVAHYIAILESALFNATYSISFKNAPSALQIYRSAVGVRDLDQADAGWIECFYDRQDADAGTQLLREAVAPFPKVEKKSKLWAEDILSILREAQTRL
jgi:hypothetical protein